MAEGTTMSPADVMAMMNGNGGNAAWNNNPLNQIRKQFWKEENLIIYSTKILNLLKNPLKNYTLNLLSIVKQIMK